MSTTLWPRAEVVVWLDLPLWVILPRLVRRTIQRVRRRVDLWGGKRERWSALFGRDSSLWWAVRSQRRHRAEMPGRLTELERSGVRTVWLTSGRAADRWLAEQAAVDSR